MLTYLEKRQDNVNRMLLYLSPKMYTFKLSLFLTCHFQEIMHPLLTRKVEFYTLYFKNGCIINIHFLKRCSDNNTTLLIKNHQETILNSIKQSLWNIIQAAFLPQWVTKAQAPQRQFCSQWLHLPLSKLHAEMRESSKISQMSAVWKAQRAKEELWVK